MSTTFQGGPLDPAATPRKFVQIVASNGVKEPYKPDQRDSSVIHGSYELKRHGEELIYVWKGTR